MPRLKKQSEAQKREKEKERKSEKRTDLEFREAERARDAAARVEERMDPEVREGERARDKAAQAAKRMDPEVQEVKRARDKAAQAAKRMDPEVREGERARDKAAQAAKRMDPEVQEVKRARDKAAQAAKRMDPEVREGERARDKAAQAAKRMDPEVQEVKRARDKAAQAAKRMDPEVREGERARDKAAQAAKRMDPEVQEVKRARDKAAQAAKRMDPEVREGERARDKAAQAAKRMDPEVQEVKRARDKAAQAAKRMDPEVREGERAPDKAAQAAKRMDPEVQEVKRARDKAAQAAKRMDPEVQEVKRARDKAAQAAKRMDPEVQEIKRARDKAAQAAKRMDPEVQEVKRARDKAAQAAKRMDPEVQEIKRARDKAAQAAKRMDPEVREGERDRDKVSRAGKRTNPEVREKEQEKVRDARLKEKDNIEIMCKKRHARVNLYRSDSGNRAAESARQAERSEMNRSLMDDGERTSLREYQRNRYHSRFLEKYDEIVAQGPTEPCNCCGGLCFPIHVRWLKRGSISFKFSEEFAAKVFALPYVEYNDDTKYGFCRTCIGNISQGKVPYICLNNGLHFPKIADYLKDLTILEERLCCPRIPFMQIRKLGHEHQSGLKGAVVNIPVSVDNTVSSLPRTFDDSFTIQLHLKRKLEFAQNYMCETIRPARIQKAVEELVKTDLFTRNGILLSSDWMMNFEDIEDESTEVPFIADEEDVSTVEEMLQNEESNEGNADEPVTEEENLNPGGQETLLDNTDYEGYALAPGEGRRPLNMFTDADSEELSFVKIYGGFKREPTVSLTYKKIAKSEVRRYDRRCARIDKLLYTYKRLEYLEVQGALNIQLRKRKNNLTLTVTDCLDGDIINDLVKQDDAFRFLSSVRNSPAHWKKEKNKAMAMVRQFNIATFFITLSAAETKWEELLVILKKVVDDEVISVEEAKTMEWKEKSRLIRSDPVTCARYFDHRFKTLFKLMKAKKYGIFGSHYVKYFYYRIEFQHRGSPHVHAMVWCNDAPILGVDDDDKVTDFIDTFISCDSSIEGLDEFVTYQQHSHGSNCRRIYKGKTYCKYHYPMPPMEKTKILKPLEAEEVNEEVIANYTNIHNYLNRKTIDENLTFEEFLKLPEINLSEDDYISAIRSNVTKNTVFLKRSLKDIYVNAFNPTILGLHRANMDIQFILNPYACIGYIVDYINKSNRGMSKLLKAACEEADKNRLTNKAKLRHIANKFSNSTEISAQECVYSILGMHLSEASNGDVFINTSQPEERERMLKSKSELEEIQRIDANSTDKFKMGNIEYYALRPDDELFSEMCLADFVAWYDYRKENNNNKCIPLQNDAGYLHKRDQTHVIRFRNFSINTKPLDFYREQIMLYFPWRDEEKDIMTLNFQTFYEGNIDVIRANRKKYNAFDSDEEFLNLITEYKDGRDEDDEEGVDEEFRVYNRNNEEEDIYGEGTGNANNSRRKNANIAAGGVNIPSEYPEDDFNELVASLNEEQRLYLTHILHNIKNDIQFYEYIAGGAGSGKTHLIKAIFQSLYKYHISIPGSDELPTVLLACPTGKAAANIDGMTLHSAFSLPVLKNQELLKGTSASMRNKYFSLYMHLKLLIIDELSLVGSRLFHNLNVRLKQIFNSEKPFGGISILAIADFYQLPPVLDRFLFYDAEYDALIGSPLWDLFKYYELIQCMRQRDDQPFALALNHLATGNLTEADIEIFKSRVVKSNNDVPEEAIHLFCSNVEVNQYNMLKLQRIPGEEITATAVDKVRGDISFDEKKKIVERVKYYEPNDTMGLHYEIVCKVGAKYIMNINIDTADGLVNGAVGILRHIDCDTVTNTATNITTKIPKVMWIEFQMEKQGRRARSNRTKFLNTNYVPVKDHVATFQFGKSSNIVVDRRQFPISCAEGMTIHKSQGGTYSVVAVHINRGMKRSSLYVACSRATSSNGLYIIGNFKPPKPMEDSHPVKLNLDYIKNEQPVIPTYLFLTKPSENMFQILFHNVQSLAKHFKLIMNDQVFMCSDVLLFVETFTTRNSNFNFSDFHQFVKLDNDDPRRTSNAGKGMACYIKKKHESFITVLDSGYKYPLLNDGDKYFIYCLFRLYNSLILVVYKSIDCPTMELRNSILLIMSKNQVDLSKEEKVFVFGDFNIDLFKEVNNGVSQYFKSHKITSLLPDTVSTTRAGTQIDWLFSNVDATHAMFGIYETVFSHHNPLYLQTFIDEMPANPIHPLKQIVDKVVDPVLRTKRLPITTIKRNRKVKSNDISKKKVGPKSKTTSVNNAKETTTSKISKVGPKSKTTSVNNAKETTTSKISKVDNQDSANRKKLQIEISSTNPVIKLFKSFMHSLTVKKIIDKTASSGTNKKVVLGFTNEIGCNCSFANASLQCLLSIKNINRKFIISKNIELSQLAKRYNRREDEYLQAETIITLAQLNLGEEHDPCTFLKNIFQKLRFSGGDVRDDVGFTYIERKYCRACDNNIVKRTNNNILQLSVDAKLVTVSECVNNLDSWKHMGDVTCLVCKDNTMYSSYSIENASDTLIVKLKYGDGNCVLTGVDKLALPIARSRYVLTAAIMGYVENFNCVSFVKFDSVWHLLNDMEICAVEWPKDNNKMYVLFYERQYIKDRALTSVPCIVENKTKNSLANAFLQCFLLHPTINSKILGEKSSPLKELAVQYSNPSNKKKLNCMNLLTLIKLEENGDFVKKLFENFSYLNSEVVFTNTFVRQCQTESCSFKYSKDHFELMVNILTSYITKDVIDIYELLDIGTEPRTMSDFICPLCDHKNVKESYYINSANNVLIMDLKTLTKSHTMNIINLDVDKLRIGNMTYVLKSGIFYNDLGSNFALCRINGDWYKYQYTTASKSKWPNNTTNVHILFYEKEVNVGVTNSTVVNVERNDESPVRDSIFYVPGFINPGINSCYANSSLQCLFLNEHINEAILNSEPSREEIVLKELLCGYTLYKSNVSIRNSLCAIEIIEHLGFPAGQQQDVGEFLIKLFTKFNYLETEVSSTFIHQRHCNKYNCDYVFPNPHEGGQENRVVTNSQLVMGVECIKEMEKKVQTIWTLLEYAQRWKGLPHGKCPLCDCIGTLTERFIPNTASNTLILNLGLHDYERGRHEKIKIKIKDLPTLPIIIGNSSYQLKSAIFHLGETPTCGHYYALYKLNNTWYKIEDDETISKTFWPADGKDVSVLFYEKQA